jgi:hypothetical protein
MSEQDLKIKEEVIERLKRSEFEPKEINYGVNCYGQHGNVITFYYTTGKIVVNHQTDRSKKKVYEDKDLDFYIGLLLEKFID